MEENDEQFKEIKEEAKKDIKEEVKEDVLEEIKKAEVKEILESKPIVPAKKLAPSKTFNWWIAGTALFFVLFIAAMFTGGFSSMTGMSAAAAGDKAIDFLNTELLPPGTEASLINSQPEAGVYNLKLDIDGEEYDSYVTKDGSLFFISGIELTTPIASPDVDTETGDQAPAAFDAPDTEKPLVQLFIMSFCPYGQQAENNIVSVVDLLGDDIEFEPHFIVAVDNESVNSLHGSKESNEDMRQACIWKYYPESWWDYVMYVNENIPLNNIDEKWTEAAEEVDLDIDSIETCAEQEGLELMQDDTELTSEYGITGSPTLLINGERYSGQRTPEAFKQAICSGFKEQPDACSEPLEEGSAPTGNC